MLNLNYIEFNGTKYYKDGLKNTDTKTTYKLTFREVNTFEITVKARNLEEAIKIGYPIYDEKEPLETSVQAISIEELKGDKNG